MLLILWLLNDHDNGFALTHSQTHMNTHSYIENFSIIYTSQLPAANLTITKVLFNILTEEARDWTTNLLISGRPAITPEPQAPSCFDAYVYMFML